MEPRRNATARSCALAALLLVASVAAPAAAAPADSLATSSHDPWWKVPVTSRARLNLQLTADEATAPWSWDAQSRSPFDLSRFMIDATLGEARVGVLYAKGAASWQDADDTAGHVSFGLEQGDVLYRWSHAGGRAFGDERRYFTFDLSDALMDDDVVDDFQHRVGVRADGGSERVNGTLLVSSLDEGVTDHLLSYAKVGTAWRPLAAALSYQLQEGDDARDHAVVKGEVAAFWKRASAIASYQQSGFGSGVFLPDMDELDNFGAGFFELRLARGAIGKDLLF